MLLNCCVGEDSWESLGVQENPTSPKGNQTWIFFGRTDTEAETPVLWPPDVKNWLLRTDPDTGKDWRQEEKGTTEDEMIGWHHWLNGHAVAAAKSPQLCLTLSDPMDCSTPSFPVHHQLKHMSIESVMSSNHLILCCPLFLLPSVAFPMSQFFASGGQNIGVSASAWVFPMNTDRFPSELTGLISLQSLSACAWKPLKTMGCYLEADLVYDSYKNQKHRLHDVKCWCLICFQVGSLENCWILPVYLPHVCLQNLEHTFLCLWGTYFCQGSD